MQTSTDKILTSHVGSLIRPPELLEHLKAKREGRFDEAAYRRLKKAGFNFEL